MNILLSELQVIENSTITKRVPGILGETIEAMETYSLKAEPNSQGAYAPITIMPVSFNFYGGVVIKGDGVSDYAFNDSSMVTGKTLVINGPTPKNEEGTIVITPKYNVVDFAKVLTAVNSEIDPTKWVLTLEDKNYLYSSVIGTPITGKLNVVGRSFIISTSGRIARITIDVVLQDGDVPGDMTSDQYNQRVAEEIQRKIEYFFGTGYANSTYNTTTKCYQIIMAQAGANEISITGTVTEDLSYFGFVSPTYNIGSENLPFPRITPLTGDLVNMDGYAAEIVGPSTIEATIPVELAPLPEELEGTTIMLANCGTINYQVVVFK